MKNLLLPSSLAILVLTSVILCLNNPITSTRIPSSNDSSIDGPQPRIIGGQTISNGNPPFQANWIVSVDGCGGAWIAQDTILTAAHCFYPKPANDTELEIFERGETGAKRFLKTFSGKELFLHPEYDSVNYVNDVAVIKFCSSAENTSFTSNTTNNPEHEIIILPEHEKNFPHFWVYGCGTVDADEGIFAEKLYWVQTPKVSMENCSVSYDLSMFNEENIICAGKEGVDSCQDDSGGPLVQYPLNCEHDKNELSSDCEPVYYGIFSWGQGGSVADKPGVYTNTFAYKTWIEQIMDDVFTCVKYDDDNVVDYGNNEVAKSHLFIESTPCICENGAVDKNCQVPSGISCLSTGCDNGYFYNEQVGTCDLNACSCNYGIGIHRDYGIGKSMVPQLERCYENGWPGCDKCAQGFHLEKILSGVSNFQVCILNNCNCDSQSEYSKNHGTIGTACEVHNSISCQPSDHAKEFCSRQCQETYSLNKDQVVMISPDYLSECGESPYWSLSTFVSPNSYSDIRNCAQYVYTVCNARCYSHGTEMFLKIPLNADISFPWDVSTLVAGNNTIFNQEILVFEQSTQTIIETSTNSAENFPSNFTRDTGPYG